MMGESIQQCRYKAHLAPMQRFPTVPNATEFMYSSMLSCVIGSNSERVADSVETKK